MRRWRRRSSSCLKTPDSIISQPAPVVTNNAISCGARCMSVLLHRTGMRNLSAARVRVRVEVGLAPAPVGDVRVDLGRREVGVAEHLLDAAEVGAALEQVGRERVAEQVRVDALRLEAGLLGEAAQDQEGAGAGQRAALRVEEELGPVAAVEVGAAARRGSGAAPRRPRGRSGRSAPCCPCRARGRARSSRSTPARSSPTASLTRSPAP